MTAAVWTEDRKFSSYYHREKVFLKFNRLIFRDIVHGNMDKYQTKIFLYLLKKKPKNFYQMSKDLRFKNHSYRVKRAYMKLKEKGFVDDKFNLTKKVTKAPLTKICIKLPAYNFLWCSKASLLMIRVLLVSVKYYDKITSMYDISCWLCEHHISRIEEAFTILRDKLHFLYAKNLSNITKMDKRKEAKEKICIYNTVFKDFKVVENIALPQNFCGSQNLQSKPENLTHKLESLRQKLGVSQNTFLKLQDNPQLSLTKIRDLSKGAVSALSSLIKRYIGERSNPFSSPIEHIAFKYDGDVFRIKNPLFEMKCVMDEFDRILNENYIKTRERICINRKAETNKTIAKKFYFTCKNNNIDPVFWVGYLFDNWMEKHSRLYFTNFVSEHARWLRNRYLETRVKEVEEAPEKIHMSIEEILGDFSMKKPMVCVGEEVGYLESIVGSVDRKKLLYEQKQQLLKEMKDDEIQVEETS